MARLPKDVVVTSKPVSHVSKRRLLLRGAVPEEWTVRLFRAKMARSGDPARSLVVARAQGKTIREAEQKIYERAIHRFPRFPRPPYLHRGSVASRTLVKATHPGA